MILYVYVYSAFIPEKRDKMKKKKKERMEKNILKERKIPLLSRNQCRYTHKTSLTLDRGICRILK